MRLQLEVKGIEVGYGKDLVIKGLSIQADGGDVVLVTGPNGSGKSTLVRALAGLQPAEFTSYKIGGSSFPPQSRRHRRVTHSVTGDWMWLRGLTVVDHLNLCEGKGGLCNAAQALADFGLTERSERMPYSLSLGELQRAALASILVRPWTVLFLDEPEQHLDEEYRGRLSQALRHGNSNQVIIAATHAPELFRDIASANICLGEACGE